MTVSSTVSSAVSSAVRPAPAGACASLATHVGACGTHGASGSEPWVAVFPRGLTAPALRDRRRDAMGASADTTLVANRSFASCFGNYLHRTGWMVPAHPSTKINVTIFADVRVMPELQIRSRRCVNMQGQEVCLAAPATSDRRMQRCVRSPSYFFAMRARQGSVGGPGFASGHLRVRLAGGLRPIVGRGVPARASCRRAVR